MPLQKSKLVEGRLPDRETQHGRAWQCSLTEISKAVGKPIGATICAWVIEAAWAHPLWANYCLAAIHLRPAEGHNPAKILLDGATHEVILAALDPERAPVLNNPMSTHLQPKNFLGQWIAASDIDAQQKIERCVDEILAGQLSPDTDFRREWIARFSASNLPK